ncbi:MAG: hypothetical protein AAGA83_04145 [Cyanobacteria bacterium P01_F01_bin.116]
MAKHPSLMEQESQGLQGLFKRASLRFSPGRRRRGSHNRRPAERPVIKLKTAPKKPPAATAADKKTAVKRKAVTRLGTFWTDLFLVRPWLLVGALWLTFIVMIAIALVGLSSPGREMALDPPISSIVGQPLSAPDAAAVARLAQRDDDIVLSQHDPAATLPGSPEQSIPAWPLLVLVAACSGGCMLMSRPGLLVEDSRRGRRRMAVTQSPARTVRPVNRKRRNRRLNGYRPASEVMSFRSDQKIHHTSPQPSPRGAKPVSFAVDPPRSVTVVPEGETSPLDWKEGSLAHRLDVRQKRSINSFL